MPRGRKPIDIRKPIKRSLKLWDKYTTYPEYKAIAKVISPEQSSLLEIGRYIAVANAKNKVVHYFKQCVLNFLEEHEFRVSPSRYALSYQKLKIEFFALTSFSYLSQSSFSITFDTYEEIIGSLLCIVPTVDRLVILFYLLTPYAHHKQLQNVFYDLCDYFSLDQYAIYISDMNLSSSDPIARLMGTLINLAFEHNLPGWVLDVYTISKEYHFAKRKHASSKAINHLLNTITKLHEQKDAISDAHAEVSRELTSLKAVHEQTEKENSTMKRSIHLLGNQLKKASKRCRELEAEKKGLIKANQLFVGVVKKQANKKKEAEKKAKEIEVEFF